MNIVWKAKVERFDGANESGSRLIEGVSDGVILVQKWTRANGAIEYNVRADLECKVAADDLIAAWRELCAEDRKPSLADEEIARAFLAETRGQGVLHTVGYKRARGRPRDPNAKRNVTFRLDQDVIAAIDAFGEGKHTEVNAVLRGAFVR